MSDTKNQVKRMLDFLNVEPVSDAATKCAMEMKEGIYKRGKKNPPVEVFNPSMKLLLWTKQTELFPILGLPVPERPKI